MIKRWIWDKTTECHILLLGDSTHRCFYQPRGSALLEFHPPIWCENKYWDSCLTGLSKWSAVSCCINSSDIKSRECVVSVISRASVFWILHSKMRELTLREKQAIWMLKEKRKSIRALAKTKGHGEIKSLETTSDTSNQLIGWENNSSWWQTNHKSCEKLTLEDVSVKSATTSRKRGLCSENLLSSGDFYSELQMLHNKMQTSDQHQK